MLASVLFLLPSQTLMRLQVLGLFFLVLLPMNLFAQATPAPAPTAPDNSKLASKQPAPNGSAQQPANRQLADKSKSPKAENQ